MQLEHSHIENLISQYKAFSIEGFNIFGTGEDNLQHIVCVCPNKAFARAIQSLLEIAHCSRNLRIATSEVTSTCHLIPRVLADGALALVASVIDDAVWKDGNEVEYPEPGLQLGSWEYQDFAVQFLEASSSGNEPVHVYEDTLAQQEASGDEFPF